MRHHVTRREFLKLFWLGFLDLFLLSLGAAAYGFLIEPGLFQVERVRLKLKRLPRSFSGIRIAQISDIHMGGWMNQERLQEVMDLITEEKPDVLLITGDFLIGHQFDETSPQLLQDLITVLSPLSQAIPTFAVLGNHDYWTNAEAVRNMFSTCGIRDLTNTVFTLTRANVHLHICGVDDIWEGVPNLELIASQLTYNSVSILLAHEPDFADKSARTGSFDLQVSGHSHGGQVVLPFLGPPIRPYLGRKYPSGLYKIGEMYQYTNRGVGMAGLPVRWNCRPEITIFELVS
ncbi:MAG TPA: metallophosphoesterase [Anaerolineales bacterium]|nr:metallophosphoesterase [Anaerolineales bacterium]